MIMIMRMIMNGVSDNDNERNGVSDNDNETNGVSENENENGIFTSIIRNIVKSIR